MSLEEESNTNFLPPFDRPEEDLSVQDADPEKGMSNMLSRIKKGGRNIVKLARKKVSDANLGSKNGDTQEFRKRDNEEEKKLGEMDESQEQNDPFKFQLKYFANNALPLPLQEKQQLTVRRNQSKNLEELLYSSQNKEKIFGQAVEKEEAVEEDDDEDVVEDVADDYETEVAVDDVNAKLLGEEAEKNQEVVMEEEEKTELAWAMKIGAPPEKDYANQFLEDLKPKDCDVYPLSIRYTPAQKKKIKILRVLSLFVCFYCTIPFDLYIPSDERIGFFGTDLEYRTIPFDQLKGNSYSFILTNCKLHLGTNGEGKQQLDLKFGFDYGSSHSINDTHFEITANPVESCIVNLLLPTGVKLPHLTFKMNGTQDNIMFEDSNLNGQQLDFGNGLHISGETTYIILSNHKMSEIVINMKFATVYFTNLQSKIKTVNINSGLYSDILPTDIQRVQVFANQKDGNICLYADMITQTSKTGCSIINGGAQTIACSIEASMCQNPKTQECSFATDQAQQKIEVKVLDGSIQIKQQQLSVINSNNKLYNSGKNAVSLATNSFLQVNVSATKFYSDTANDRIAVLQTMTPSYQRSWFYTNKIQILQAQYWPLAWGSVGLLRPIIEKVKVILIDYTCPARAIDLFIDSDVDLLYYNLFPKETMSINGFIEGYSKFKYVALNDVGERVYRQIVITDNPGIMACFGIAATIAIVGAIFGVQLSIMAAKVFKKKYNTYLLEKKQLAISKKQATAGATLTAAQVQNMILDFENQNKIYEVRGLCNTTFHQMEPSEIVRLKLKFNFSLFQIPALIIDFMLRQRIINSLQLFLGEIDQCKHQFSAKRLNATDKSEVSMPLTDFQKIYSDYCQQNGYRERDIELEGKPIFEQFNIVMETQEEKMRAAYVNIRFKTPKEKLDSIYDDYSDESSIRQFLMQECVFSSFEKDFLFFEEITEAYYSFCRDQGIQESQQEQIIGNEEMTNFGSTVKDMSPPSILIGIKLGKSVNPKNVDNPLVRRPANIRANIMQKLISLDGIGPNLALTACLYLLILVVPVVTPVITFLALSEMTRLQEGVFKRQITFLDFYATNRLDPWWNNTPYVKEFALIHIYVLVYLVFAFIELVSFFMTGLDNNGKFPIQFKPAKRMVMVSFYILTGIFIFYYVAMLWFALVWCLLSSILNPSKFLPYTAAALGLFATIGARWVMYKVKYKLTIKRFQDKISARIAQIFQKTLAQVKSQGEALASKIPIGGILNQGKLGAAIGVKLDEGANIDLSDGKQLAQAASKGLDGLDPGLIELITAIIIKDFAKIKEILIKQISNEIGMDPEFLLRLSDIALSDFNPGKSTRQLSYGITELAIKKLFRKLFPSLNVDLFDQLITLVLQRDPNSIKSLLNNIGGLDKTVFEIFNAIKLKDKDSMKRQLFGLHQRLLSNGNESVHKLFKTLYQLREGEVQELLLDQSDFNENSNTTANQLNFKHCFPALCMIGQKQNSSTLDTLLMTKSIKEVLASKGLLTDQEKTDAIENFNTSKQSYLGMEQLYLAFYYIMKGEQIDMKRISSIVKGQGLSINGDMMETMHMCSQNSQQSFEQILIKLNCTHNKAILIEFYQLMQRQKVKFMNICSKLMIPDDSRETFTYLIYLLYRIIKYDILVRKTKQTDSIDDLNKEITILRGQIKECLDEIEFNEKNVKFYEFEEFKDLDKNELQQRLKLQILERFKKGNDREEKKSDDYTALRDSSPLRNLMQKAKTNITEDDDEEGEKGIQGEIQNQNKKQIRDILKIIISNVEEGGDVQEPKTLHKLLWTTISNHGDIKKIIKTDEILSFIRCSAFLLLKSDSLLQQTDPDYMKCYFELSEFYEIDSEKLELLIDLISGNPLDLFNLVSKTLEYSIQNDTTFKGTFDPFRLQILQTLLQGSKRSLMTSCMNWYHQYRYFSEGKKQVKAIMEIFNLNNDFLQILRARRLTQSDDNLSSFNEDYIKQIKSYLKQQIQIKKENLEDSYNYSSNLTITQEYFTTEDVKDEAGIIQPIQEIQLLSPTDQSKVLVLMEKLILIKQNDSTLLKQLISMDQVERPQKYMDLIKNLLQVSAQTTASRALNTLLSYAQCIPLFDKLVNWLEDKIPIYHQDLFVQFNLIIHASQFNVLFNKNEGISYLTNKSLIAIVDLTNEALNDDQNVFYIEERDFRRALQALYENNYFQDIAMRLFSFMLKKKDDAQTNQILGVLLGSALNDKKLLLQSVLNLLKTHDLKQDMLNGIGQVITQDIEEQEKVRMLCRQLEIDGDFLIKIMELANKNTKNLPSVIIDLLAGHQEEQQKICTSFLYVMKRDLTMVKTISDLLGISSQDVTAVLACATGNFSIMSDLIQPIQEKLGINSQKAMRYFLQLAHGDSQCIFSLQQKRSQNFQIYDAQLVEAVYNITYIGGRIYSGHTNINECEQIRKLDSSINFITNKLTDVFHLESDTSNKLNNSLKILIKACWNDQRSLKALYKKLQIGTGKKSYWYSESKTEVSNHLTQFFSEKEILKFIRKCLQVMVEDRIRLREKMEQKHKEMLKSLKNIMLPHVKKLYTGKEDDEEMESKAQEEYKKQEEAKLNQNLLIDLRPGVNEGVLGLEGDKLGGDQELEEEKEFSPKKTGKAGGLLSWLGFGKDQEMSEEEKFKNALRYYYTICKTKEDDQIVRSLPQATEKISYRIGCTYGLTLTRMISQPLYYCQTCNEQLGVANLGICIICAQFCHKNHVLVEASNGQNIRSICDCGAGKFNNCPALSRKSPIASCRDKRECSVIRKNYYKIQDAAIDELQREVESSVRKMNEFELYQKKQFLIDLTRALQLPQLFENKDPLYIQNFGENLVIKNVRTFLYDESLKSYLCLAENLLLMAFGQISNSFLTIFGNKKNFSSTDLQNQSIYTHHENTDTIIYKTMASFVAVAQADYSKLARFGIGLAEVLGEKGFRELTPEDKFSNVIRLARGGQLPKYDPDLGTGSQICKNSYARIFQQVFGMYGKSIMILHYMLTLSSQQMVNAMGFKENQDEEEQEIGEIDTWEKMNKLKVERENVQAWVNLELFSNFLQMTDHSVEYCKSLVGVMCKYDNALDFIASQKEIGQHTLHLYKALIFSQKEIDLQPIFNRLNSLIPSYLNCQLRKVWKGDMKALIEFIVKYIEVDASGGDWSHVDDFDCSLNNNRKIYSSSQIQRPQFYRYLSQLYQLMIGDKTDQEKVIAAVFETAYYTAVHKNNIEEQVDAILDRNRILGGLYSIAGILYHDNLMQPKIAEALQIPGFTDEIVSSLIAVVNQQWNNRDIQTVLRLLLNEDINNKIQLKYCKNLLQATEGDIVALAKIEDDILVANGTYLRSFIVSAITGQIQFDSLLESDKGTVEGVRKQRNLLRRECYRIFEKITRICYPSEEQKINVDSFIRFCFDQKFPLHLLGLMSQDRNFLSKLISGTDEFLVNLIDEKFRESYKVRGITISKLDQKKKYLQTFIDFLDPFNIEVQLKPLLKMILNYNVKITIQKDKNALEFNCLDTLGIKGVVITRFKEKILSETQDSFDVDALDLTQMFYNCFTLDRRATTLIFYYLAKIYENSPILSQILQIQQGFIEGRSIFENLNSIVLLIMAQSKRLEMCEDLLNFGDKEIMLIKQVTLWLDGITMILSKDKNQNITLLSNKFREIIKGLVDYYGDDQTNPLVQNKDNIFFVVDALIGLISIIKGDFSNMKSLAVKLGGFPQLGKLEGFIKVLRDNKSSIKFSEIKLSEISDGIGALSSMATGMLGQVSTVTNSASAAVGLSGSGAQDAVNNGVAMAQEQIQQVTTIAQQGIKTAQDYLGDDPIKLITNPRLIFQRFCNIRGKLPFENFVSFIRMIGLPITHAQMIRIFSIADRDKTGEIDLHQFKRALEEIKMSMIHDTLVELGLSVTDLIISGIFSLVILLLTFAFIFVGIESFAPSSSFSSVTNTTLPLVATGTVNSQGVGGDAANSGSKEDDKKSK